MPKTPAENECELHRIINVKINNIKLIIRIFMKVDHNRIRAKIDPNQCAFLQGSVTINAIFFYLYIAIQMHKINYHDVLKIKQTLVISHSAK